MSADISDLSGIFSVISTWAAERFFILLGREVIYVIIIAIQGSIPKNESAGTRQVPLIVSFISAIAKRMK